MTCLNIWYQSYFDCMFRYKTENCKTDELNCSLSLPRLHECVAR